jgi:hypothetical protein
MSRRLLAFALLAATWLPAQERLAVVVNPGSGLTHLTREEARDIFLGRSKYLKRGLLALPVEQVHPQEVRERFYLLLVNLPLAQVRSYWARLYFTGQAQPPRQTESDEETLQVVSDNRGAIGFLPPEKVDHRVRVVLTLEPADTLADASSNRQHHLAPPHAGPLSTPRTPGDQPGEPWPMRLALHPVLDDRKQIHRLDDL